MHQETVDNYLEDIILSTIEHSADEQARGEMQVIAEKIDKAAQMTEAKFETLIFYMICLRFYLTNLLLLLLLAFNHCLFDILNHYKLL